MTGPGTDASRRERIGGTVLLVLIATFVFSSLPAADGVTLYVKRGPAPGDLTLDWTGGQPTFEVYSATDPSAVVLPANSLGTTGLQSFVTLEGPEPLLFFLVTTPCVVNGGEVCDGEDNDCNGQIDEGAAASCSLPNAVEACEDGGCVIDFCDAGFADCDDASSNGCEYAVAGFDSDPLNCGTCNFACPDPANAAPECAGGDCGYTCDSGFVDCNDSGIDGCETSEASMQTDSENCGECGVVCSLPNALGVCNGGFCQLQVAQCDENYYDVNGDGTDGCEYFCEFSNAVDEPDDLFIDANCDGIDGTIATAIFASPSGNDGNPGTMALPVQTVPAALLEAQGLGRTAVYLDQGVYLGQVNLIDGISIHGGYNRAMGWARSASFITEIRNTTAAGGTLTGVSCVGVSSPTKLDRLRIVTGNAPSGGTSNYAVRANTCPALTINSSTIQAGHGGAGSIGSPGSPGANGNQGGSGLPGSCDGAHGNGGSAGPSSCGRPGGAGGRGGLEGANAGVAGSPGTGGTPGGSGGPGGDPGLAGGFGFNGAAGAPGNHGTAGSGGTIVGLLWVGTAGGTGTPGSPGNGGGGGGGGGGQGCTFCDNGGGNGGGGGGAGGCAGGGGFGGGAGGGSFGVFLVNSNGVVITTSTIQSGNGGSGGAGLPGGNGGAGGAAGFGASACSPSEVGRGGNGGVGGAGGNGGAGGGGAGGVSWSVYRHLSTVTLTGTSLIAGFGGPGGSSPGNPGATGASGTLF